MENIKNIINDLESYTDIYAFEGINQNSMSLEEKRLKWVKESGIPLRYQNCSFDNFEVKPENSKVYQVCKKYEENFPLKRGEEYKSIVIFSKGTWGVGKTHLVCAMGLKLINKCNFNNPILYYTEQDLFMKMRGITYELLKEFMDELSIVPLLIVDDVGKEEIGDPRFVQRTWFSVINCRYNNCLPIVLTTNLDITEIAYHFGAGRNNEASMDRLYEMTNGVFYELRGESYRRKQWKSGK